MENYLIYTVIYSITSLPSIKKLYKSINRIDLYGQIKWGGGIIEEITVLTNNEHRIIMTSYTYF